MSKNLKHLNKSEFVEAFLASNDKEGNMSSVTERTKLMTEMNKLISKGYHTYEAIMKLCEDHSISFTIEENDESTFKITTFMNKREWSHHLTNFDSFNIASKATGKEIFSMLCVKFVNSIYIDHSSIKKSNKSN